MRYRLLGPSGLRVSELCLGTMSFGEAWGFGADEKQSHRILDAFAEAGGNFVDTANAYHEGQSEEILGSFLGPDRDRWVVATKYTLAMRPGDPNAAGNSRKNLRASVEASLRRLRTDYLDVLWVHAWDYTCPVEEVMRGLDDLVSAGKVNHVALSDAPAWVASAANTLATLRGWSPLVALQAEYSLLERTAERELLPVAEAFGLSLCAWAPMGAGILTGKYTRGPDDQPGRQPPRRRQPGPPDRAQPPDRPRRRRGRRRAGRDLGPGGRRLAAPARPAGHPDPGRAQAGAVPGRPGQPGGGAGGRARGPLGRGEPDRARVPLRAPAGTPGADGLRRPRTPDRPALHGALPLAGG